MKNGEKVLRNRRIGANINKPLETTWATEIFLVGFLKKYFPIEPRKLFLHIKITVDLIWNIPPKCWDLPRCTTLAGVPGLPW